ncbi:MAG TPA: MGMT family protein [Candidatus Micrarchaeota archaeon]|nr:MGMT family protein [Candidatus Micrarchaeota archaeon]
MAKKSANRKFSRLKNGLETRFPGKGAHATDFEWLVYSECLKIPKGKTLTYRELAIRIGKPRAARAVGNALGKNPFAPFVPCHRVVKSDGTLGGYSARGGIAKKKKILLAEKKRQ